MSKLREYMIDEKRAVFNKEGFRHILKEKARQEHTTMGKLEEQLASNLYVSPDAVHKWHQANSGGPGSYEMVKKLAEAMELSDCSNLLMFINDGGIEMERLTDRQKTAAKRIYDICIWFLYEFERTDGFNDYWLEFKRAGSQNPESDIYDKVEGMIAKINLVLDQEYFDLRGCDLYNELCEYVSDDLYETFNGKLSYAYRFEAHPNGNPTTSQDYDRAMIRLNTIIDKYL